MESLVVSDDAVREKVGIGQWGWCNPFIPMTPGHRFKSTTRIPRKEKRKFPVLTRPWFCSSCSQGVTSESHPRSHQKGFLLRGLLQAPSPWPCVLSHALLPWFQHPNSTMFVYLGPLTQRSQLRFSLLKGHEYAFQSHTWSQQVNICSAIRASWLKVTL